MLPHRILAAGICVVATTLTMDLARADVIDGNWCHPDGRRLSIRGPEIVTPGGNRITGDYDRHAFNYRIPTGEPAGGQMVFMVLRGEYVMQSRTGPDMAAAGPLETWNRCAATVS